MFALLKSSLYSLKFIVLDNQTDQRAFRGCKRFVCDPKHIVCPDIVEATNLV